MHSLYLAVDIGSSSLKGGLLDARGDLKAFERVEFAWTRDPQLAWSAQGWLTAFRGLAGKFAASLSGVRLAGLAVSGNGPTLVALDRNDRPTGPLVRWNDPQTGTLPDQKSFYLPKAAWFRTAYPDIFMNTVRFLTCPDYLTYRLTGNPATTCPSPAFSEYIWDEAGCRAFGLPRDLFPAQVEPGALLGRVAAAVAVDYGLPAGTPVYAAGSDFLMALLGTAAVRPGETCDRAGTSEGINHCSAGPVAADGLRCLPHIIPGLWNVAGILSGTGLIFEWYRRLTGQELRDYREILGMIQASGERHSGDRESLPRFFPSFNAGARWEFDRGMFIGLGAHHGREEIGLAVVESIAFSVRQAIRMLEESGCPVGLITASGGQARNAVWNQMKADMLGTPIRVPLVADAELVGCLCCALKGEGKAASLAEAAGATVRCGQEYLPDPRSRRRYDDWYERYRQDEIFFRNRLSPEKS